ncbi:hypothetical protein GCM10017771_68490 [Streptomyces capitiformicae]|uniref:Uncharacterized protein n=1 Tax=Streptomyces capitiformicae TaxID=2014920 RepID=A0A918ZE13_9ACTN|nr:hypothetical protein GCM10017771_68490 [Streptomyces capitiformicae]
MSTGKRWSGAVSRRAGREDSDVLPGGVGDQVPRMGAVRAGPGGALNGPNPGEWCAAADRLGCLVDLLVAAEVVGALAHLVQVG